MKHPIYEHPSAAERRDLRAGQRAQSRMLSAGPWCWPEQRVDADAYESAREAVGSAPRPLDPGEVALVTVDMTRDGSRGELWAAQVTAEPMQSSNAEFVGAGHESWLDAQCALPRALPLLWGSVRARHDQLGPILKMYSERSDAVAPLDTRACGLALALALASSVLDVSSPADVIAAATLDERGALGRVGALADRLRVIDELALSVRRVVVASDQREEALACLEQLEIDRLEIVSFSTLSAALNGLLDDPTRAVDSATPDQREELVDSFLRLALGEQHASLEWSSVERAAGRALGSWGSQLSPGRRRALEFTRAVAARHHYKRGNLELPSNDWLQWFPLPLRLRVLAHATQQASDTGAPDPRSILDLTRQSCPELTPIIDAPTPDDPSTAPVDERAIDACCGPHMRLLGAIGRMQYSALGDLHAAIHTQITVCVGWQRCWEYDETPYPLSALFTYVSAMALDPGPGAQHAPALFTRVDALWSESQRGGRRCREDLYVKLARGRALATLLRFDEAVAELDPLITDLGHQGEQLRLSAARWRMKCAHSTSGNAAHDAIAHSDDPRATLYRALLDLDVALSSGDPFAAEDAAKAVHAEQTALCDTLLRGADLDLDDALAPAFLARRYPY